MIQIAEFIKPESFEKSEATNEIHTELTQCVREVNGQLDPCVNDPSAGSPTETLLRLLLPLNVKFNTTSSTSQTSC